MVPPSCPAACLRQDVKDCLFPEEERRVSFNGLVATRGWMWKDCSKMGLIQPCAALDSMRLSLGAETSTELLPGEMLVKYLSPASPQSKLGHPDNLLPSL